MAARPDFATDLRAMCKRHYLGTNLAQQAIPRAALASPTLNEIPRLVEFHDGRRGGCLILFGKPARATKDP
jgi:hypothetical protein